MSSFALAFGTFMLVAQQPNAGDNPTIGAERGPMPRIVDETLPGVEFKPSRSDEPAIADSRSAPPADYAAAKVVGDGQARRAPRWYWLRLVGAAGFLIVLCLRAIRSRRARHAGPS